MKLTKAQINELIGTLSERFASNPGRHKGASWAAAEERLLAEPAKLASLFQMESTGGDRAWSIVIRRPAERLL